MSLHRIVAVPVWRQAEMRLLQLERPNAASSAYADQTEVC